MKKKLKDITLKELKKICQKAQYKKGCVCCPFYELSFKDPDNDDVSFCPLETLLPNELANQIIELDD